METPGSKVGQNKRDAVASGGALSSRTSGAKCFQFSHRWFDRLVRAMMAAHTGFWLGCLSPDDLNRVTADYYEQSQHLASLDHNLGGLFDWEKSVLDRFFQPGSRILVASAGAGREVLALRKAGYQAEGFDCNMPLVSAGHKIFEELGDPNYVEVSLPDSVPPGESVYNGLFVGWGGYTHIPTKARRVAFLQALRSRGLPHSRLLMSFFVAHSRSRDELLVSKVAKFVRVFFRRGRGLPETGDNLGPVGYFHVFTRDDVQAELSAAGFELAHYSENDGAGHVVGIAL